MMHLRKGGLVAAAVVTGLVALAGCGDGEDEKASATPSPGPTESESELSPTPTPEESETTFEPPDLPTEPAEPTGPLRVTDNMTQPGAHLSFGEKAVVPFRYYDDLDEEFSEGVIGVVVERVQQVPGEEIGGNFDDDSRRTLDANNGYYTRITITNESGDDLRSVGSPEFELLAAGGGISDVGLIPGGDIEGCTDEVLAPDSFDREGATWDVCEVGVSSSSRPLTEVHYVAPPYGEEWDSPYDDISPEFNEYYDLGAIVWS